MTTTMTIVRWWWWWWRWWWWSIHLSMEVIQIGSHNKFSPVWFLLCHRVILRQSPKHSIYFRGLLSWYWSVYIHMGFEVVRVVRESVVLAVLVYIHTHRHTHTSFMWLLSLCSQIEAASQYNMTVTTTCCWYHKGLLWL
jgi:hypothetical protein